MAEFLNGLSRWLTPLLGMSVTAAWAAGVIFLLRLFLRRRAPRWVCALLWLVVFARLLLPVSLHSPLSAVPPAVAELEFSGGEPGSSDPAPSAAPADPSPASSGVLTPVTGSDPAPAASAAPSAEPVPGTAADTPADPAPASAAFPWRAALAAVWLLGAAAMLGYALFSYIRLRRRVYDAVRTEPGVWEHPALRSPFLLGVGRPRIYLPTGLAGQERAFVLAHERAHIRRGDWLVKPLCWIALSLHWFNPMVWVAFLLMAADMEAACDQAVLRRFGEEARADYSSALLSLATGRRIPAPCPLAFGEGDAKGRIKTVLNYKKPAFWVILAAVLAAAAAALCLLTDPVGKKPQTADLPWDVPQESAPSYKDYFSQVVIPYGYGETDSAITGGTTLDGYSVDCVDGVLGVYAAQTGELLWTVAELPGFQPLLRRPDWIYGVLNGTELIRIDYHGQTRETLFTDATGGLGLYNDRLWVGDGKVTYFRAGLTEGGLGVYRLYLPDGRTDLIWTMDQDHLETLYFSTYAGTQPLEPMWQMGGIFPVSNYECSWDQANPAFYALYADLLSTPDNYEKYFILNGEELENSYYIQENIVRDFGVMPSVSYYCDGASGSWQVMDYSPASAYVGRTAWWKGQSSAAETPEHLKATGDVNGDGLLESLVLGGFDGLGVGASLRVDGTEVLRLESGGAFSETYCRLTAVDLDGDGRDEVLVLMSVPAAWGDASFRYLELEDGVWLERKAPWSAPELTLADNWQYTLSDGSRFWTGTVRSADARDNWFDGNGTPIAGPMEVGLFTNNAVHTVENGEIRFSARVTVRDLGEHGWGRPADLETEAAVTVTAGPEGLITDISTLCRTLQSWLDDGDTREPGVTSGRLADLAVTDLDLTAEAGVGLPLVYESDSRIIFWGIFGIFGYDLERESITFSVDFRKLYGEDAMPSVQGSSGITGVYADPDGTRLAVYYGHGFDPCFIDLTAGTWEFSSDAPVGTEYIDYDRREPLGELIPGGRIEGTTYIRGDRQWKPFSLPTQPISELAPRSITPDTPVGMGCYLNYADEDYIIFQGDFGLFGYDLNERRITFAMDLNACVGASGFQGSDLSLLCSVSVERNRRLVQVRAADGSSDTYYLNTWEGTYYTAPYKYMEEPFDPLTLEDGALGALSTTNTQGTGTLNELCFRRRGEVWMLFEGYFPTEG